MKSTKQFKKFVSVLLTAIIILSTVPSVVVSAVADDVGRLFKNSINTELKYGDYIYRIIATSTNASPTDATPTDATPTDATPTDATPTDATSTDATPTDATPTDATSTDATPTDATPTDATSTDAYTTYVAEITLYTGNDEVIRIPSEIKGYPVKSIGDSAFSYCTSLKSITMSNVTSIGDSAFSYCTSLTSIIMSDVISIGDSAFYGCTSLTNVWIGENATDIRYSAFGDSCNNITIYGISGSYAESFANKYNIKFVAKTKAYGELIAKCDYDGDGILTVDDVAWVLNMLTLNPDELTEEELALADVNGDGSYNLLDAYVLYAVTR